LEEVEVARSVVEECERGERRRPEEEKDETACCRRAIGDQELALELVDSWRRSGSRERLGSWCGGVVEEEWVPSIARRNSPRHS
jgi:hypothetical protein